MGKRLRRLCDGTQCRDPTHFHPARAPAGDPFFNPIQKQEADPVADEEQKDPLADGLKLAGENLLEHEPFKKWYEPKANQLKLTLWDNMKPAEKAAMLGFLGVNLGMAGAAFATNPELRQSLSDVNIGKPLGWIPYSPIEGFRYKLPGAGKTATGFSADLTFNSYLDAYRKGRPNFPLTGATLGLESSYDPAGGFNLTGGKFGLDFFGGGLKAEGKTFNSLSPYPMFMPGRDGMPGSTLMQQYPGLPDIKTGPGFQLMLNADLLKLFPTMKKYF